MRAEKGPAQLGTGTGPSRKSAAAKPLASTVQSTGTGRDWTQPHSSLLDQATAYAAAGWPVFPLHGKVPALAKSAGGRGFHNATTEPATVAAMWARFPGANIGVRTGEASGLAVLDVDGQAGVDSLVRIETDRGVLPGTLMQQTGSGGLHFFYRWRPGIGCGTAVWGRGLDLRGEGGYIVVAPSIHPVTGQPYRWVGDGTWQHELPDWPAQLPLERPKPQLVPRVLTPVVRPGQGPLAGLVAIVLEAPQGQRNDRLNWAAFRAGEHIRAGRLNQTTAVTALQLAAERVGLTVAETRSTIVSGLASGLGVTV